MTLQPLLLASLLLSAAPAAPPPPKTLSATRTTLLAGHLTIALPEGMKLEPRTVEIMSAPRPSDDENRAVLDVGKARLVMMVSERYETAPADPKAAIQAELAKGFPHATLEALPLPKPLRGFGASISLPEVKEANLVYMAWLLNADQSVQMVGFFVNPEGAKHGAAWSALAKTITASARAGTRRLALKGGARDLGRLRITLPDGWTTRTQPGPDFVVYHLTRVAPLGSHAPRCGIYVGGYPSFQYRQAGIDPAQTHPLAGTLLGQATEWVEWTKGRRAATEAITGPDGQKVHVFCFAHDKAELPALRRMAATLRER